MGAIVIFTSLIKPSPSGFSDLPKAGKKWPMRIPSTTRMSTWTYRTRYQGVVGEAGGDAAGNGWFGFSNAKINESGPPAQNDLRYAIYAVVPHTRATRKS